MCACVLFQRVYPIVQGDLSGSNIEKTQIDFLCHGHSLPKDLPNSRYLHESRISQWDCYIREPRERASEAESVDSECILQDWICSPEIQWCNPVTHWSVNPPYVPQQEIPTWYVYVFVCRDMLTAYCVKTVLPPPRTAVNSLRSDGGCKTSLTSQMKTGCYSQAI